IDPDNVSGTRSRRVVWPAEAENRPPAPRKDICRDQQLAALLAAWWGSGDRDAARVLADARGRSPAAGDRDGIRTAHVAEIEYLNTQKHLHGSALCSPIRPGEHKAERGGASVRAVIGMVGATTLADEGGDLLRRESVAGPHRGSRLPAARRATFETD